MNNNLIDTAQDDRVLWELQKPDWDKWKAFRQVRLWEAVALALEIDPSNFHFFREHKLNKVFSQQRQPPRFTQLLKLAVGNISAGGVLQPISIDLDSMEESEILLSNFVKWAKSIKNFELPPNFPSNISPRVVPKVDTLQGENYRSTLLALIAVLVEEAKLDLTSPSKTAGVIEDFTARLGARVAARTIENHLKRIGITVNKPLLERERSTLLTLIAALAMELDLPIIKPAKAASLIEALTKNHGIQIEARVIEEHLKRIPRALDKRSR